MLRSKHCIVRRPGLVKNGMMTKLWDLGMRRRGSWNLWCSEGDAKSSISRSVGKRRVDKLKTGSKC